MKFFHLLLLSTLSITLSPAPLFAAEEAKTETRQQQEQPAEDTIQVTVQQIGENVHMLQGKGGNITVSSGPDGVLMIDADHAEATPTILKAVSTFTDKPVKYLINTHWHGDHTAGNHILGDTGTIIIAHDNVRPRLSVDNEVKAFDSKVPAQPASGLPALTYSESMTVHLNGDDIKLLHFPTAHTDGDTIIHFPKSNVIATGDIYFNGFYPYIDAPTGGTLDGMIATVDAILSLADENTKIVPGHGPLSTKPELQAYRDMLDGVRQKLKPMIDTGQTLEDIAKTDPLAQFNPVWGNGILPPEKWLGIVYDAMKPAASKAQP